MAWASLSLSVSSANTAVAPMSSGPSGFYHTQAASQSLAYSYLTSLGFVYLVFFFIPGLQVYLIQKTSVAHFLFKQEVTSCQSRQLFTYETANIYSLRLLK